MTIERKSSDSVLNMNEFCDSGFESLDVSSRAMPDAISSETQPVGSRNVDPDRLSQYFQQLEITCSRNDLINPDSRTTESKTRPNETSTMKINIAYAFTKDADGDTRLHNTIIQGFNKETDILIKYAGNPNYFNIQNNKGQTPLHLAALTQQKDTVRSLITRGCDLEIQDENGNTALHLACMHGCHSVIAELLTPIRPDEEVRLRQHKQKLPVIPQILEKRNYDGMTCLHLAAYAGSLIGIQMLVAAGADVNFSEAKSGRSILHLAAEWHWRDLILFLVYSTGIQINRKNYSGYTAADLALGRGFREIVQVLQIHGSKTAFLPMESDSECE